MLLSENINELAGEIKKAISMDLLDVRKSRAKEGVRYYNHQHDILKQRIFYVDDNKQLHEDTYASNARIVHSFLTELIDQKVQLMLSNPVTYNCDDELLYERLGEYYNSKFQTFLQDLVEEGSQKGYEYVYARTTAADKLAFQLADSLQVLPIFDEDNQLVRILYYHSNMIRKDGKKVWLRHAELYDNEKVWYFIATDDGAYQLDQSKLVNPAPHVIAKLDNEGDELLGRSYGTIPFFRYQNNRREKTDLEPIKSLIDDYDLMDAFLSNNLQDLTDAFYVVKGFDGNIDDLNFNIRAKKRISIPDSNGDLEMKTVEIPVEGRKTKLQLDRENIYKFGFGFDSAQIGDGNITNVVILGRYTLLNMKANKTETRLREALEWMNQMVIDDINRRFNTSYHPEEVSFEFTREMLINKADNAQVAKTEAETNQIIIQTLLAAAPLLPSDEVLKQLCDMYDLDFDDIQAKIDFQDYDTSDGAEA
ncbi:phage portal protein [Lactococcus protaetiae]|uniref:Phage portal protein n=1 Tax=Lactococcus protaetiae TaxID=2592653 RepID=A0A514Z6U8_9LACT|nr:phage portal protein [Lactococcus protaetiae]QDK70335.1 phage portal protein [Lactococcus protaetiae]